MSVGSSGDIGQAPAGFDEQASPSIPGSDQPGQFPTDATNAALAGQGLTSEQASEGAEQLDLTEEDLQFLQSEQVLNYLKENLPQGFLTEEVHNERLSAAQSTTHRELAAAQRRATDWQAQFEEHQLTAEQLANALSQSWQEQGLAPGSPEWNERVGTVRGVLDQGKKDREYQRMSADQAVNQLATQETSQFRGDLELAGVSFAGPHVAQAYKAHMERLRGGTYQTTQQIDEGRRQLVAWARQQGQTAQQQVQPQVQPQAQPAVATQAQPAAQTRSAGATRSARGGGGSGPRTYDEYFQAKHAELVQQYGDQAKVPVQAILDLDKEAAEQVYG